LSRVGILGGAFNPPHIGHLVCAQEALARLELDSVLFVPVGEAPHREIEDDPGRDVRVELGEAAVAGDERFGVSRLEVEREGKSYTVDTLRQLAEESPGDEHVLILGGDQASTLPSWREPEEVLRLATVAVTERTGHHREAVAVQVARLAGSQGIVFFDMPRVDVSSSMIRHRVAAGRPIRYFVPDRVGELIADRGLYRASASVASG
jgi:nicotinate-nucleotide adenylyltransferase